MDNREREKKFFGNINKTFLFLVLILCQEGKTSSQSVNLIDFLIRFILRNFLSFFG